jgi:hypothetical protein
MTVHNDRHKRRLDDGDEPPTDPSSEFASRLARRLVLTYTGQGETDADRRLRDAAGASSRACWPSPSPANSHASTPSPNWSAWSWCVCSDRHLLEQEPASRDLFIACQLLMSADMCVIAAVSLAEPDQAGTAYAELALAAQAARLTDVPIDGDGDQFLYCAARAADTARGNGQLIPDGRTSHINLLVFATRQRRHD